jgi:hypothetical protein
MILQIRHGVYETNSSSIHTFYVKKDFHPEPFSETKVLHAKFGWWDFEKGRFENKDFLSYVWTALVFGDFGIVVRDRNMKRYWQRLYTVRNIYKRRMDKILSRYNVKVVWEYLNYWNEYYSGMKVDHADFFIPILDKLLANSELFVSLVLCNDSHFYTGNDNDKDGNNKLPNLEGYQKFVKRNYGYWAFGYNK